MRRGLRKVQLPNQGQPPPPRCLTSRPFLRSRAWVAPSTRAYSTSSAAESAPVVTTSESAESRQPFTIRRVLDRTTSESRSNDWSDSARAPKISSSRIVSSSQYRKWQSLLRDFDRLAEEADFSPETPLKSKLVHLPEHQNDLALWSALFNFAQRRHGQDGALDVWQEIFRRRALINMEDGVLAHSFWQGVAEAALQDESFLESAWAYAEFVYEAHGQSWPKLYHSVLVHCLENRQYARALLWHVRLSPNFEPGRKEFFSILKAFMLDRDEAMQTCLQSMYATSTHRELYDTIVPYLWSQGRATLARRWRLVLTRHSDVPMSPMSGPFLQYAAGYFPEIPLCPEEKAIAAVHHDDYDNMDKPITNFFYTVNRVHGETFGVREKNYNDELGAKWFATRWISIDRAIEMVQTLGFQEIGPLSFQSIALRAQDCNEVLERLEQLHQCQIGVGSTNYVKLIKRLAVENDFETLRDLLTSDLHPDVFEDDSILYSRLLDEAASLGDWRKYRLVYMARLIRTEALVDEMANGALSLCVESRGKTRMLKIMADMEARGMQLSASNWRSIVKLVCEESSPDSEAYSPLDVDFHTVLCRQITIMKFPVAAAVWQDLLTTYGTSGRLNDVDGLALELVSRYSAFNRSPQAAMRVHDLDVPETMRRKPGEGYRMIPPDLPFGHKQHPVQLIFSQPLQQSIIEWGFRLTLERLAPNTEPHGGLAATMQNAHVARGIKLLGMLRDGGVNINENLVRSVAGRCIARLLCPPEYSRMTWRQARLAAQQLSIKDFKHLCDEAWGSELLPSSQELLAMTHERADYIAFKRENRKEYLQRKEEEKQDSGPPLDGE